MFLEGEAWTSPQGHVQCGSADNVWANPSSISMIEPKLYCSVEDMGLSLHFNTITLALHKVMDYVTNTTNCSQRF